LPSRNGSERKKKQQKQQYRNVELGIHPLVVRRWFCFAAATAWEFPSTLAPCILQLPLLLWLLLLISRKVANG
jgi:hypothetical protein